VTEEANLVLPAIDDLRAELAGRELPGGALCIERHESLIASHALRAPDQDESTVHPLWLVIASLRSMGITVTELCGLARAGAGDTLLFGGVAVTHDQPLVVGTTYRTQAAIGAVDRHQTRAGKVLDSVVVTVRIEDSEHQPHGTVTSTYLFMRGAR
jgi:endonuclease YncB( thermonuclease family)